MVVYAVSTVVVFVCVLSSFLVVFFFFFNDTATTEIYTLSLHDALPILQVIDLVLIGYAFYDVRYQSFLLVLDSNIFICLSDRKSTRLNSSHMSESRMPSSA